MGSFPDLDKAEPAPEGLGSKSLPIKGVIRMSEIYQEFGAPSGTPFSDMLKGGDYVGLDVIGGTIPETLPIAMSDFLGAVAPARVVVEEVTGSGASNVVIGEGASVEFDLAHGAISGGSSVSTTVTVDVVLRLVNPAAANCYVTCDDASFIDPIYVAYSGYTPPSTLPGGTPPGGVGVATKGPLWSSDGTAGVAEWQTSLLAFNGGNVSDVYVGAVLLASGVVEDDLVTLQVRLYHSLSVASFTPVVHQGVGQIIFNPVLQFRDGGGVVRDTVPVSITVNTAGQLTAVS